MLEEEDRRFTNLAGQTRLAPEPEPILEQALRPIEERPHVEAKQLPPHVAQQERATKRDSCSSCSRWLIRWINLL